MLGIESESFPEKVQNDSSVNKLLQSLWVTGWSTVVQAVADDAMPALILLTNWCFSKMASREIIIICILYWPYCVQTIIKIGQ